MERKKERKKERKDRIKERKKERKRKINLEKERKETLTHKYTHT